MNLNAYKGVFVYIEQRAGEVQKVSLELLGKGREIADQLGVQLTAVMAGHGMDSAASSLIHQGADAVLYADDPALAMYTTEPYTQVLAKVITEHKPEIFLIGATSIGRDLGPRVSARVQTGLTADCTSLDVSEDRQLMMTRPAFGGNLMATIICPNHRPQMSTVRPGVMQKLKLDTTRKGTVEKLAMTFGKSPLNVEVLEFVKEEKERINIQEANVLVSGGRGMGSVENFGSLNALAGELNGVVSASRAVVDQGWIGHDRQVGQTGQTVRPDLYMAMGISGAIQHVAGMEESEFILAINKDPGAAIFNVADLGVVGDVHKIVPLLVEELQRIRAEK